MTVYAVDLNNPAVNPIQKFGNIASILNLVVPLLMSGAALLFLIMLLRAGFKIITAGGDPNQISAAQKMMTFAVIGLVVIISSYTLIRIIGYVFQISDKLPF